MEEKRSALITGGCQCGAIRYALYAEPFNAHLCHCRMCQKAVGGYFAPLASVGLADFAWTRSAPAVFASSSLAERGFCPNCGTPLTFRYIESDRIAVTLGSLDRPAAVRPEIHYGVEARLPWLDCLQELPSETTESDMPADMQAHFIPHQHPDHETESWPPLGGES